MKKLIFLMSAFLLTIFLTSAFSYAQTIYNQSAANQIVSQPGYFAFQPVIKKTTSSINSNFAAVNPGENNLSSFMRDSASGDGLGKYLANNSSNPSGTNYQSYFSPSQVMTSMSRPNPVVSSNSGSSTNKMTRSETDLQARPGSDDISRSLANITERLNMLQQKLEMGGYNQNSASSNNPQPLMTSAKTNEITSASEMYSSDSLDQIKAKLDEMSRTIDAHMQAPRENPVLNRENPPQYRENPTQYKTTNSSPRIEEQLTNFQSYSQLQFDKYFSAAQEQLRLGNFYQAADSFTLASIYEPDNSFCYAGHGHALFAAGQFVSSALYIIRAIELNPDYIQTNIDLVTITGGRDNITSRITELEQLLKKAPASGLQFLMAYVYYRTGLLTEARQIINAAYLDMPNSRAALALKIAIDTKLNSSN